MNRGSLGDAFNEGRAEVKLEAALRRVSREQNNGKLKTKEEVMDYLRNELNEKDVSALLRILRRNS